MFWEHLLPCPLQLVLVFNCARLSELIKGILIMFMNCLRNFMLCHAIDPIAMIVAIIT